MGCLCKSPLLRSLDRSREFNPDILTSTRYVMKRSFAATYYLPIYFQAVHGSSPTLSGVQMLPFSLLMSITSALTGLAVTKWKSYRYILWQGWVIMAVGYALSVSSRPHFLAPSAQRHANVILTDARSLARSQWQH